MNIKTLQRLSLALVVVLTAGIAATHQSDAQRSWSHDRKTRTVHKAGEFDYYALVLSWSPTHCDTPQGKRDRTQCSPRRERGYAFILHGLWPQYEKGYPEKCRTQFRPYVTNRTIASILDIMPSKGLIIHEYRKHGTCSGLTPPEYFQLSRTFYDKIKIPATYRAPQKEQFVSPDDLIAQFQAVNPELERSMIRVVCRGSGNRLREVRICFSKDGTLRACGQNEVQRRLCSARRMFVPPVRYSRKTRSN